jgi:hypothetical protein
MVSVCKVRGCKREQQARGFCLSHYTQWRKHGDILYIGTPVGFKEKTKCRVDDCDRDVYARDLCRKHYASAKRNNDFENIGIKCNFPECDRKGIVRHTDGKSYCNKHTKIIAMRVKYGFNPFKNVDLRTASHVGENNPRWSGGTRSYFKNHYTLKKNRKERLKRTNGICEACKKEKAYYAVHLDGNKDNHEYDNLRVLCTSCRSKRLRNTPRTSKFKKQYGYTLRELISLLKLSYSQVRDLHKQGLLDSQINLAIAMRITEHGNV